MNGYEQIISENLKEQDEREFALGDTLDIKTSIALVVITFLATQSADFLKTPLSSFWHVIQRLSVVCIIIAGVLALIELIPRGYKLRMAPDKFLEWINQTVEFYESQGKTDPESSTAKRISIVEIEKLKDRFKANSAINEVKSSLMAGSFYFTMVAVALNLATLAAMYFGDATSAAINPRPF
jgi:hypothetical protein